MKYRIVDDVQTGETASKNRLDEELTQALESLEVGRSMISAECRVDVQAERRQLGEQLRRAIELGVTTDEVKHFEENCVDSECPQHGAKCPEHGGLASECYGLAHKSETFVGVEYDLPETVDDESSDSPELTFSEGEVPCAFLTGKSGSGKTTYLRNRMEADPGWGLMCSSTGISAINLGTITINSLLGYFDTDSMEDAWISGQLNRKLREVAKTAKVLCIDEISMVPDKQLTILYRAIAELNGSSDGPHGNDFDSDGGGESAIVSSGRTGKLGLLACGDFAQLPPVKANWAFESEIWVPNFSEHVTKLDKIWRQTEPDFVAAMNALREGNGKLALDLLVDKCGIKFHDDTDPEFEGTTIVAKNEQVDRLNQAAQMRVKGSLIQNQTKRVGLQRGEWQKNIPNWQQYKVGSYVMLLSNQYTFEKAMVYANGDCGYIREWDPETKTVQVELVRNGKTVNVGILTRENAQRTQPKEEELRKLMSNKNWVSGERVPGVKWQPWKQDRGGKWVVGEIEYLPLRLAYASTVHRSQGISLDRLQADIKAHFMGSPAMLYVTLSRVKTIGGLKLVGTPDLLIKRCTVDPKVAPYL